VGLNKKSIMVESVPARLSNRAGERKTEPPSDQRPNPLTTKRFLGDRPTSSLEYDVIFDEVSDIILS